MSGTFVARVGGVMSADIAVPEHERVVQFYSRVLTTGDAPLWREDLMNSLGLPVVGLGKRVPEYEMLPLQWMPHIQVADVAASAARAVELGGEELLHGKAEDGTSQWAALLDRDGAAFGLIPIVTDEQMPKLEGDASGTGQIAWLDLTVPDAAASRDFYREVVGWSVEEAGMSDADGDYADYTMVAGDGNGVAGVCHARGTNASQPPVWMLYLPVGDLVESIARVRAEGGEILRESLDGGFRFAVLRDPVGVCLTIVQA